VVQGCDVYIGRACHRGGWRLPQSRWHNPFTIRQCGSRRAACEAYRRYLLASEELMAALPELAGQTLGCFCAPEPCHGDVLVEVFLAHCPNGF
jgi:hypothetical protein